MNKTSAITVRLDPQTKQEAQAIFEELGLSTTQAISLFLRQVALHKGFPFAVELPNAETLQAIEDGIHGRNVQTFKDADAALDYLKL